MAAGIGFGCSVIGHSPASTPKKTQGLLRPLQSLVHTSCCTLPHLHANAGSIEMMEPARPVDAASTVAAEPAVFGPEPRQHPLLINGQVQQVWLDPATTLVEVLRDQLGLT